MLWLDYMIWSLVVGFLNTFEFLNTFKDTSISMSFLQQAITHWMTERTFVNTHLRTIDIICGIFQDDSFSPLLFIVVLTPLSLLLHRNQLRRIQISQ